MWTKCWSLHPELPSGSSYSSYISVLRAKVCVSMVVLVDWLVERDHCGPLILFISRYITLYSHILRPIKKLSGFRACGFQNFDKLSSWERKSDYTLGYILFNILQVVLKISHQHFRGVSAKNSSILMRSKI